jgi:hypothetical protein
MTFDIGGDGSVDTLKEAGYESGDVIASPIYSRPNPTSKKLVSTSSTTYKFASNTTPFDPGVLVPEPADALIIFSGRVTTSGSDPPDVRVRSLLAASATGGPSVIFEETGISPPTGGDDVKFIQPASVRPDARRVILELRNGGTNGDVVSISRATVYLGFEIP